MNYLFHASHYRLMNFIEETFQSTLLVFKKYFLFFIMCMIALPACMQVAPVSCSTQGDQKRASDPLELELWSVVNCHVGASK